VRDDPDRRDDGQEQDQGDLEHRHHPQRLSDRS
jgi:hypothetical protein